MIPVRRAAAVVLALLLAVGLAPAALATSSPSLPDPSRTPGAVNPDVTPANIGSTICRSGWTATIRPSSSYTTSLKRQQLSSGYAVGGDRRTGDYEEDHLISLELGGSPDDPENLWPEPYFGRDGARIKDRIENKLKALVCSGQVGLRTAQRAIATNWIAAYRKYIGTVPTTAGSTSGSNSGSSSSSTKPPGSSPAGATARCKDGTYSYSQTHSGTCSHHGGVAVWLD